MRRKEQRGAVITRNVFLGSRNTYVGPMVKIDLEGGAEIHNCVLFPHWVLRPFWKWLLTRLGRASKSNRIYKYHITGALSR
jgi:hypothetical protein